VTPQDAFEWIFGGAVAGLVLVVGACFWNFLFGKGEL
jgi:hypothetical protein